MCYTAVLHDMASIFILTNSNYHDFIISSISLVYTVLFLQYMILCL